MHGVHVPPFLIFIRAICTHARPDFCQEGPDVSAVWIIWVISEDGEELPTIDARACATLAENIRHAPAFGGFRGMSGMSASMRRAFSALAERSTLS